MAASMEPKINEPLLDEMLTALEKAKQWSPRTISRLESLIRTGDDLSLFRINPLAYAKEKGVDEQESVDLFLHGTVTGLFEMGWHLLCPGCTSVVDSFASLNNLNSHFHCEICNADSEASLDDYINVTFTVSGRIRDIIFHHPELLNATDFLAKFHFSREGLIRNADIGEALWLDVVLPRMPYHGYIQPGEKVEVSADIKEGFLIATDLLNHFGAGIAVSRTEGASGAPLAIRFDGAAITPERTLITPGKTVIRLENRSGKRGMIALINMPPDYHSAYFIAFAPFLSGKRLLTNQSFRNLFRYEVVQGTEGIGVKDISIIFTDLKGSTSLYERIGDLNAFSLVREHFDVLGKVVSANAGAIVKTIGDAVMGSFMTPHAAVKAALEMRQAVQGLNKKRDQQDIILKIGIHKGASIVVNLNERLDYFGQTVNIASRVQQLAEAGQIYITPDVYDYPGVRELLAPYLVTPGKAKLKGIEEEMPVYLIQP